MTTFKTWIVPSLFALNASAFAMNTTSYDSNNHASAFTIQHITNNDTVNLTTLTITKVKKPWYATKGLVVKKMKKSFPEYSAVQGLQQKYYSFTEDHHYFGGIYLWNSEQDSKNWFNQAWFDRTEKKYGVKGIVLSYQIQHITTMISPKISEDDYFAVLSHSPTTSINWNSNSKGLIQVIELKDANQKTCYLSLWETKQNGTSFCNSTFSENEHYEAPLILKL